MQTHQKVGMRLKVVPTTPSGVTGENEVLLEARTHEGSPSAKKKGNLRK